MKLSSRSVPRFVLIALLFLAFRPMHAAADGETRLRQHPVTLGDLQTLHEINQLQISPDGDTIAFMIESQHQIWLVHNQPNSVAHPVVTGTFPVFSPDSRSLAYYSNTSGTFQLWVLDLHSHRRQQLTHFRKGIEPDPTTWAVGVGGWVFDPLRFTWSPDSKRIVFPSTLPMEAGSNKALPEENPYNSQRVPLIFTNKTPPDWTLAGLFRVGGFSGIKMKAGKLDFHPVAARDPAKADHLFIVDIAHQQVHRLTPDNDGYFSPDWSPDGRAVLCVSWEGRSHAAGQSPSTNLYIIDVTTGNKSAITQGSAYRRVPSWSPDGTYISFLGATREAPEQEFLYVIPRVGGTNVNVSSNLDRRCYFAYWSPQSDALIASCKDGVNMPIIRLNIQSGVPEVISDPSSANRLLLAVSKRGPLIWAQSDPLGPAVIHSLLLGEHFSHIIANVNPQVAEWKLGEQEVIRWKTPSGAEQEGVLIKPVGYQKGQTYPLIVDPYPKLGNGFKGDPMGATQAFASQGYAVFFPNGDGPHVWQNPWKSMTQTPRAKGPDGVDIAVEDVVSGVDELISRGVVDPERMCLYGFSNGGGMVNQLITRTKKFRCAVSVGGAIAADWSSLFFIRTEAQFIPQMAGTLPWDNPSTYVGLSAVYHLDHVTTPLLLADGDDDGGFLLGCIEMYNGLRYLDRDVTLLRYPKQGHGFTGPALSDFWNRESQFFARYLKTSGPRNPSSE